MARKIRFKDALGVFRAFKVPASDVLMSDNSTAQETIDQLKSQQGQQGGSVTLPENIIETEENGFFLVDDNLNIGGYVTASGSNMISTALIRANL